MLSEKSVQSYTDIYIYSVILYKHSSKKSIFIIFVIFVTGIKNTFTDYQKAFEMNLFYRRFIMIIANIVFFLLDKIFNLILYLFRRF